MNKVFLVGRLSADPEKIQSSTGNTFCRITIATSDLRNRKESYFFPCVAFGNQASYIAQYSTKGDLVAIDGRLTRRSFVNKEGKNSYVTEVICDSINTLQRKNLDNNFSFQKTTSIDEAFPESIPINHHPSNPSEPTENITSDFKGNESQSDEIKWPDDE